MEGDVTGGEESSPATTTGIAASRPSRVNDGDLVIVGSSV
jgi:hypothetical protein